MFRKILIANRGEIAVRVIRACRDLGVESVAIYSAADREALHVGLADEAIACGEAPAADSYLRGDAIVEIARACGAEAIHPGYGFLSENADFAETCEQAGLTFIGPPASVVRVMGDKLASRRAVSSAGIAVVPGSESAQDDAGAIGEALAIGLPVVVKASAGGGGRGMRIVHEESELPAAIERARSEAARAFGVDAIYLEKLIERPRHVEVQILADHHGGVIHLFERECSIQRRHQKVIEEAPAPGLDEATRMELCAAAVSVARAVGYRSAGTCEFLLGDDGRFYFLEMNTRIQVEHAITELTTGIDLVTAMIRIAAGEPIGLLQSDIRLDGHAIEARICAERADKGFIPSPGKISRYREPTGAGIRVDSGVAEGAKVTVHYDPLIAKLIAWGPDRAKAIERLSAALEDFEVEGIHTTLPFHRLALGQPAFVSGRYDTGFIDEHLAGGRGRS